MIYLSGTDRFSFRSAGSGQLPERVLKLESGYKNGVKKSSGMRSYFMSLRTHSHICFSL